MPGSYKLSGKLVAPTNKQDILIAASNVTLDLRRPAPSCYQQHYQLRRKLGNSFRDQRQR
jgi:hypothetical protein